MHQKTYKSRTQDVRRNARAHLKELRQARRRQRAASLSSGYSDEAVAPQYDLLENQQATPGSGEMTDQDFVSADTAAAVSDASQKYDTSSLDPENEVSDDLAETFDETTIEREPEEHVDHGVTEMSEAAVPALEPDDVGAQSHTDLGEAAPDLVEAKADGACNLDKLPGAGPGLIWMLNECGIYSLADLSQQEPHELASRLGIVGQILDVSHWVRLAESADAP